MRLIRRYRNLLQFQLEQFIVRGTLSRLAVIALAMILIALGACWSAAQCRPRRMPIPVLLSDGRSCA